MSDPYKISRDVLNALDPIRKIAAEVLIERGEFLLVDDNPHKISRDAFDELDGLHRLTVEKLVRKGSWIIAEKDGKPNKKVQKFPKLAIKK